MDAAIEDEWDLDEIELGERVAWWLLMWDLACGYSSPKDRESGAVTTLVGSVAASTSHLGHEYPEQWRPRLVEYGQRPTEPGR